jgi:glycosyltransferase involved in cell wall biosynthesis
VGISVVISTLYEEKNLARCLASLTQLADEIAVVESLSTHGKDAIAHVNGAKFIHQQFNGHIEQRNYAVAQANNDIILSLDADVCRAELVGSIKGLTDLVPS